MRQIMLFVSFMVLFSVLHINAIEPNFVRSTIFKVDGTNNITTTDYSDGLGHVIQSKQKLANGRARVVSTFYDNASRPYLTTKPFVDLAANSTDLFTPGGFTEINEILNNNENYDGFKVSGSAYAYSETQYYDDVLGRVKRAGAPGNDYKLTSEHFTSSWTFGVVKNLASPIKLTVEGNDRYIKCTDGFVDAFSDPAATLPVPLTYKILDNLYDELLKNPIANAYYFLSVSRDPDEKISQELKDLFGKTVATRTGEYAAPIIAGYEFNVLGNVLLEHAPKEGSTTLISDSKYEYNTLGQLVRKETPDGVIERMYYDNTGNLTDLDYCYLDGNNDHKFSGLIYVYDGLSRVKEIQTDALGYEVTNIKKYYDNTDQILIDQKKYGFPLYVCEQLQNLQGRLVAEIAFNRVSKKVIDMYSYDDDGRIKEKYKIIPGLPLQKIEYTYDIHGKVKTERFLCGTENTLKTYNYNPDGYLSSVTFKGEENATPTTLVEYTYDNFGKLKEKKLSAASGKAINYQYNIRDWLMDIVNTDVVGFSQSLKYGVTTFNGNVDKSVIKYNYKEIDGTAKSKEFNQDYSYDNVNRLTDVLTNSGSVVEFNAHYAYDQAGRFKSKQEGTQSNHNDYHYYSGKSRLLKSKTSGPVYIYDRFGNMVLDASKNMTIKYDWRNMPVEFTFYDALPVGETSSSKIYPNSEGRIRHNDTRWTGASVDYISYLEKMKEVTILSKVYMLYDAAGNRVLKIEN